MIALGTSALVRYQVVDVLVKGFGIFLEVAVGHVRHLEIS